MLNAKTELTNAISKKPLLEQQIDGKLSVFFNGGYLIDFLKKAGEVNGDHGNSRSVCLSYRDKKRERRKSRIRALRMAAEAKKP